MNELKHNAFLNSASRFWKLNASLPELSKTLSIDRVNSAKRFLRKRFRSLEVTQRLTPYGSFEVTQRLTPYGSFEVTQRLASGNSMHRSLNSAKRSL
ncbi:hypothetical protein LEP1GSC170_1868 [Leptospira interrogans serovar Bataviae str. HAI135]|nr:hypothetical protein LEP1GSC170_1868 [Leptospira interrogans serovar Bataviae str. HAI135]